MTPAAIAIAVILIISVVGRFVRLRARQVGKYGAAAAMDRLKKQVDEDVRARLSWVAAAVSGEVEEGPSLRTGRGLLTLVASRAPAELVIDVAKFSGPSGLKGALTVVRAEDLSKLVGTKGLRRVAIEDPEAATRYVAFASDAEAGRRWVSREFAGRLRALEEAVRARCRVQVVHGNAAILAFRGLAGADELKSFHDGAVAVLEALEAS